MRVAVIREKKIQNIILADATDGNHWITETDSNGIERNLISIEAEDGRWKLVSNRNVYYVENMIMKHYVYLKENSFYMVRNELENYNFVLYTSPTITNYNYYEIGSKVEDGILIGKSDQAVVKYPFIEDNCCQIKKANNKIFIVEQNAKNGIYVNNARINKYKEIKNGDVIFVFGLKMMYVVIKDNHGMPVHYLCVNDIDNKNVKVDLMSSSISFTSNSNFEEKEENLEFPLYDENEYFYKIPRFVRQIKKVEMQIDAPPNKQEDQTMPIILTVGPMLTMSLTSVVTLYSSINGVLNGTSTWASALPSLIMGGAMLLSMILWPTISRRFQKKLKKKKEKRKTRKV